MSISGPRKSVESSFSDMSISSSGSGFDSGPGFAMSSSADMDTSSKSKGISPLLLRLLLDMYNCSIEPYTYKRKMCQKEGKSSSLYIQVLFSSRVTL